MKSLLINNTYKAHNGKYFCICDHILTLCHKHFSIMVWEYHIWLEVWEKFVHKGKAEADCTQQDIFYIDPYDKVSHIHAFHNLTFYYN